MTGHGGRSTLSAIVQHSDPRSSSSAAPELDGARTDGPSPLASARQQSILDILGSNGSVRVSDLVERLGVSDMTIRRDLAVLAASNRLRKVHGGAVAVHVDGLADEPGFEIKSGRDPEEKHAIAARAVDLVTPGMSIAISAGTTTWAMAQVLARTPQLDLTIVTNSANVWMAFQSTTVHGCGVILTGGMFRTPSDALVGPIADAALRSLYVDKLFLGVHGMDPDAGYTTPNLAEAETNRTMISRSRELVVIADHSKWRTIGLCTMAALSAAAVVVSDDKLPAEARTLLPQHVGRLILASVDPDGEQ